MYDEFNENDGEKSNITERPTGGIYSGQINNPPAGEQKTEQSRLTDSHTEYSRVDNSQTGYSRPNYSQMGYSQSTDSSFSSGQNTQPVPEKKEKKKNPNAFWKKIVGAVVLGIVFGLTAGITVYFVNSINGKIIQPAAQITEESSNSEPIKEVEVVKPSENIEAKATESSIVPKSSLGASAVTVMDVSDVVEHVMPSVVSITGNYTVTSQDFWGQIYSQQSSGSGSGIIIGQNEDSLLIATNNHVVEDSDSLSVQFIDGSTADARIKGTDKDIDLAVIIVDISDLQASTKNSISVAVLGDSDSLKVGETAIAIGNALGYGQSVTTGVISAVDRKLELQDGSYADGLIQTDAAINPGNSGGALVNAAGEVVGINSSKIGGTTIDGVGFAIPISSAEPILDDIVTSEERVKVLSSKAGYLGISGVTVTEEASQMYGIPVGIVVRKVYAGAGAEKAGIVQGDVITAINGKSVESMEGLKEELQYYAAGETVSVDICRISDGDYVTETVELVLSDEKSLND